ncbi:hypothetical protein M2191_004615 [Bradyrhizobium japonicum]|nr:hypothetical protein [Bradyrhizobium japonicum]
MAMVLEAMAKSFALRTMVISTVAQQRRDKS